MAGAIDDLIRGGASVLDALHDGVVVVDAAGIVRYVNLAHERITGLKCARTVGRHVLEVVPDSSLPEVLATGRELIGVRTRVGDREVVSNIVPIRSEGKIIGGVSVFRDITEVSALSRELERAESRLRRLAAELSMSRGDGEAIVGKSPRIVQAFRLALKAAQVPSNVLIQGESGAGKEVLARYIHAHSPRADRPFIAVNCAAIPESLLESELFGYEEGAFTGARKGGKAGLFELADGGSVFLDEIADMPLALQAKLLRVLQGKEVKRVGGTATLTVDVRVLAATNRDLKALAEGGQFRQDLYWRLNVIPINLPPLRERREDLPMLVEAFLARISRRLNKKVDGFRADALKALLAYDFPGNVRELENIIEQAIVLNEDRLIGLEDLPDHVVQRAETAGATTGPASGPSFGTAGFPNLGEAERQLYQDALRRFPSRTDAARALGISRSTLYRKIKTYGL